MLVGAYVFSCILGVPMIFFSKGAMYFFHSLWKTTCTSLFCSTVVHFRSPTFPYTAVYFISLFKKTDEAFILWYLMFLQLKCYRYKKTLQIQMLCHWLELYRIQSKPCLQLGIWWAAAEMPLLHQRLTVSGKNILICWPGSWHFFLSITSRLNCECRWWWWESLFPFKQGDVHVNVISYETSGLFVEEISVWQRIPV